MAIKEDNIIKKAFKKFFKNPSEALKFYANLTRIKWYLNKKSGKLPSIFSADNMRIFSEIKRAKIKRITADGITKNCIITNSNFSFTTNKIKIKNNDKLSFSIRLNKEIKEDIVFKVNIEKNVLFLKKINKETFRTRDWLEININLDKYKNENIRITFSTNSNKNNEDCVIWSEPIILNKDENKTNVIIISLDSCRKDHLSCYGYKRKTTPNIDKLNAINFENVFSHTVWTDHSHKTIFTGLYPVTQLNYEKNKRKTIFLSEIFRNNGYTTYSHNGATRLGPEILCKGFDQYVYRKLDRTKNISSAEDIINSSIKFIKNINENPFFMFLHFMEAHEPYDIPNPYHTFFSNKYNGNINIHNFKVDIKKGLIDPKKLSKDDLNYITDMCDSGIRYFDNEVEKLVNILKELKIYDNTLIVILSDHGEEFLDHDYLFHYKFYDETINVPLIIKPQKSFKKNSIDKNSIIELIDVYPTILDILNIKLSQKIQGKSAFIKKKSDLAFSEHWITDSNKKRYCFSIRSNKYKYIYTKFMDKNEVLEELYDLEKDSKEKNNIANKNKKIIEKKRNEKKNFFNKAKSF